MAKMICGNCYSAGRPKTVTSGNILFEIVLWLLCLLPGLCYTIWRLTTRAKVCRACESPRLVPLDSPVGRQMAAQLGQHGR